MRKNMGLYRGKQNGTWVEGSLLIDEAGNCYIGTYLKSSKCDSFVAGGGRQQGKTAKRFLGIGFVLVDPETVGMCSGVSVKYGRKIFEGDIVYIGDHIQTVNGLYLVIYDTVNHCWALKRSSEHHHHYFTFSDLNGFAESATLVGNIHDNPELLEVSR